MYERQNTKTLFINTIAHINDTVKVLLFILDSTLLKIFIKELEGILWWTLLLKDVFVLMMLLIVGFIWGGGGTVLVVSVSRF